MRKGWLEKPVLMLVAVLALSILTTMAYAQPLGAENVSAVESSRYEDSITPQSTEAQAGNVTELLLNTIAVTKSWQGFYGNITGELILADASDNRFYDWDVSTPSGQVYASRSSALTWVGVQCLNSTQITTEEAALGQDASDPDSITNTFATTDHPSFDVGTTNFDAACPTTQAYNATGEQGGAFWQVLLADETANSIYTTIIEDATTEGFNARPWHFQLLVGENGRDEVATTTYYFYIEIV